MMGKFDWCLKQGPYYNWIFEEIEILCGWTKSNLLLNSIDLHWFDYLKRENVVCCRFTLKFWLAKQMFPNNFAIWESFISRVVQFLSLHINRAVNSLRCSSGKKIRWRKCFGFTSCTYYMFIIENISYRFFQADADKIKELQEKLRDAKSKGDEVKVQSKNSQLFKKSDSRHMR